MLTKLESEMAGMDADACLPGNLTDHWLRVITLGVDNELAGLKSAANGLAIEAMRKVRQAKEGGARREPPPWLARRQLEEFRVELAIEAVRRKAMASFAPATLETIFTWRSIPA